MTAPENPRRRFLRNTLTSTALAGIATHSTAALPLSEAPITEKAASGATASTNNASHPEFPGYLFLTPSEASFVEALVDHMIPADQHSPKGSDLRINIYFDRTLNGNWGKGDRLYTEGPWKKGIPEQGYQLPLVPAMLFRVATQGFDNYLVHHYQKSFAELDTEHKESVLHALEQGKIVFDNEIDAKHYFSLLYQLVIEGMFSDPIYGGNADKAAWKMIGFPGVIATHTRNIVTFKNKPFPHTPLSIADAS